MESRYGPLYSGHLVRLGQKARTVQEFKVLQSDVWTLMRVSNSMLDLSVLPDLSTPCYPTASTGTIDHSPILLDDLGHCIGLAEVIGIHPIFSAT